MKSATKIALHDLLREIRDDQMFSPETRRKSAQMIVELNKKAVDEKTQEGSDEDKG